MMYSIDHARYAIPAGFKICIFVLVVLPTILLLWYPLGPKVLSFCGLGEISVMSKVVPLHKMKPFFDFSGRLDSVEWIAWNGTVEWNSGMEYWNATPTLDYAVHDASEVQANLPGALYTPIGVAC